MVIDEGSQWERELVLTTKMEPRNFSPALLGRQERGHLGKSIMDKRGSYILQELLDITFLSDDDPSISYHA